MTPKWGQNLPDASPTTHPQVNTERKKKAVRGKFLEGGSSCGEQPWVGSRTLYRQAIRHRITP
jgi:hypothetical protein